MSDAVVRWRISVRRVLWGLVRLVALAFALWAVGYVAVSIPRLQALPGTIRAELARRGSTWVPSSQIPTTLRQALIATEDQSFETNWGISFEGIGRALLVDLKTGQFVQGGSTITQELVRDQLLTAQKTIPRKIEEMLLALTLTRIDSKSEILDMYFNEVYFGNGAYGLSAASQIYFGERPSQLTPAQATLLAGLPQAPSAYNPLVHPTLAKIRQREVLTNMVSVGYLTPREASAIASSPWSLVSVPLQ